jgi:hypothetical protein
LIGLKLNKIGRIAELPDTPEIRDMIAKVAHLVRIIEGDRARLPRQAWGNDSKAGA